MLLSRRNNHHHQHASPAHYPNFNLEHIDTTATISYLDATSMSNNIYNSFDFRQPDTTATTWGQMANAGLHRNQAEHRRGLSGSSVGSDPSSPYIPGHRTPHHQYTLSNENSPSSARKVDSAAFDARNFHLPTPTQTPTQDSFGPSSYTNYNPQNENFQSTLDAHIVLNQAMDHQNIGEEEAPGISHSSRHSVSSYGEHPSTPHDSYEYSNTGKKVEDWIDEYLIAYDEPEVLRPVIPKFERTVTEVFNDLGYDPSAASMLPNMAPKQSTYLHPSTYRTVMSERLRQAQSARSQSPSDPSMSSRGASPFRNGSPLAPFGSPRSKLGTAAQAREQQKELSHRAMKQTIPLLQQEAPKTISPKDVELEYHQTEEDAKMPLFENYDPSEQRYTAQIKYDNSDYGNVQASRSGNSWQAPQESQASFRPATTTSSSNFSFQPPTLPGSVHGLPMTFSAQNYRSSSNMSGQEESPEFPAHLTSMESSASEAAPPSSNTSNNNNNSGEASKPSSALADTGTYTCTYHGCTHRFETPQKLQRHKREAHRQNPQSAVPSVGSSMTSAALLARNSQAGPHKCERINPTTGKPCNTIFSRPYDLTRHEDTIHNVRKQKVRCALCVEEKTFSRNDALTRHMRVVHPEVDFPGKHRRRGHD